MNKDNLIFLKNWFSDHCRSFYSDNEEDRENILLKETHTYDVCKNCVYIAEKEGLNQNDVMLTEATGLFHDVGRFTQYLKYKTFKDSVSENHGKLGANILAEGKVLDGLPSDEQAIILNAVKFHNAFHLPSLSKIHSREKNERIIFFLKLVRDADKLDIFRVFLSYCENKNEKLPSAADLGLPDGPGYSEEILSSLVLGKVASYSEMKTLNDFRLLQLSWIYDLNFDSSLMFAKGKDFLNRCARWLPHDEKIESAIFKLQEFVK